MKLPKAEFENLTLREFDYLIGVYSAHVRRCYDYPAALICSVLAELKRDPKRRTDAFRPTDFLPGATSEGRPEAKPPAEQLLDKAIGIVALFGGTNALPATLEILQPDGSYKALNPPAA